MQCVLLDQVRANAGKIALRQFTQLFEQQSGHRQVQHGVTEELKPFIVIGRETAVRHRLRQQLRILEGVLQALLQCPKSRVHAYLDVAAYFMTRYMGPARWISLL